MATHPSLPDVMSSMATSSMTSNATATENPVSHGSHRQAEDFICGGVASFVNVCATFPINKVMFRQQVHGIRFFQALRQLCKEGLVNFYRGLLPPLQRTATVSLMFGTYNSYKDSVRSISPNTSYVILHTAAAIGAGTTEAILALFERIQVVLQVH